ncbi:MAG: DUF4199 domain-containing protein [Gemmatimonadaceae bacterium]|nr:DUF4199 domain-containing protein [Gemmatimonadaceae bacterium]
MKKIVWTYGLMAGAVFVVSLLTTALLRDRIGFEATEVFGYTTMLVAFLMVFFGIRSYRDRVLHGAIGFGAAFKAGVLITLIASACYIGAWEFVYYRFTPDFGEQYAVRVVERAKADGKSVAEIAAKEKQMAEFVQQYKNPVINVAYTFIEVFPVGLVVTLVSAGILSRRPRVGVPARVP